MKWNLRRLCRRPIALLAALLVTCAATSDVHAGIVATVGVTPLGGPPAGDVHPGTQPVLPTPIVFPEVLGGVAPAGGIPVDHNGTAVLATPVETGSIVNPLLLDSVIPAGTLFESYFFHFDPVDTSTPGLHNFYDSSITFSTPIIGVQLFTSGFAALDKPAGTDYVGKLEAGDAIVAPMIPVPLAYYPGGLVYRGLEEDALGIAGAYTIMIGGEASGVEIDQVRIFVEAVPEPTSFMLASMGLLGLLFLGITRVGKVCRRH